MFTRKIACPYGNKQHGYFFAQNVKFYLRFSYEHLGDFIVNNMQPLPAPPHSEVTFFLNRFYEATNYFHFFQKK